VRRNMISIRSDGAELELAVDRGCIEAGGRREPISEIEIELKRGEAGALTDVVERLARSVPAAYGARTKPDRGYALSTGHARNAVRRRPIVLEAAMTAGDVPRPCAV
jgi:triphosphatase